MIYTFDKVRDFMHMVDIQPERAKIEIFVTNNSYTHVYEAYIFGGVLRGFKQKPMAYSKALWFGEGTTLKNIKEIDEYMAIKIEQRKYKLP